LYEHLLEKSMRLPFQKSAKFGLSGWKRSLCLVVPLLFLFVSSASAVVINLAWDPGDDASGYKIHYGKTSGTYTKHVNVGNTTSYPLDLPMGKWYIALTAYDAYGNESDFSDEVSWPIQVFSPAPGEVVDSGSSYLTEWYASSSLSSFNLYYSMNGGASWTLIEEQLTGTRSANWGVPTPRSNKKNCLIKVVGFDTAGNKLASDIPNAPFAIEVVELLSPNAGEVLTSGDSAWVTWQTHSTQSIVDKTRVLLTKNGGATWATIFEADGDPGGFEFNVPDVMKPKKQCKLKVILKDSYGKTVGTDASNGYFTIRPPNN
jgi:hypothetical protein